MLKVYYFFFFFTAVFDGTLLQGVEDVAMKNAPSEIDAFAKGEDATYFFINSTVYVLKDYGEDDMYFFINSTVYELKDFEVSVTSLRDAFPDGPSKVTAAVFHPLTKLYFLIDENKIYTYKIDNGKPAVLLNTTILGGNKTVTGGFFEEQKIFLALNNEMYVSYDYINNTLGTGMAFTDCQKSYHFVGAYSYNVNVNVNFDMFTTDEVQLIRSFWSFKSSIHWYFDNMLTHKWVKMMPTRVDAVASEFDPRIESSYVDSMYFFENSNVYMLEDKTITVESIREVFPGGPSTVTAALYNPKTKLFFLVDAADQFYAFDNTYKPPAMIQGSPRAVKGAANVTGALYVHINETGRQLIIMEDGVFGFFNYIDFDSIGELNLEITDDFSELPAGVVGGYAIAINGYKLFTKNEVIDWTPIPITVREDISRSVATHSC